MINGGCTGSGGRRALAGLLAVIAQPLAQQAGIDVMLLRDVRQRFPGLQALGLKALVKLRRVRPAGSVVLVNMVNLLCERGPLSPGGYAAFKM